MSAKDTFHDIVKHALIKDHWIITADPLYIRLVIYQPETEELIQWIP